MPKPRNEDYEIDRMARRFCKGHPFDRKVLYDFVFALRQFKGEEFEVPKIERWLSDVRRERKRQDRLWGEQNHPPTTFLAILGEEFGEVCQAALEKKHEQYRKELVQVAAVAVQMIEAFDRAREGAKI